MGDFNVWTSISSYKENVVCTEVQANEDKKDCSSLKWKDARTDRKGSKRECQTANGTLCTSKIETYTQTDRSNGWKRYERPSMITNIGRGKWNIPTDDLLMRKDRIIP